MGISILAWSSSLDTYWPKTDDNKANVERTVYFRSYWSYKNAFIWTKYVLNIHRISSLDEQVWIQTFHNKSLFQFITILSNSRQNISYKIIFTFNMVHYQDVLKTAFWCTFHLLVVFTGHNTVTFINNMQNKNHRLTRWGLML
jgi:hypothetical protein